MFKWFRNRIELLKNDKQLLLIMLLHIVLIGLHVYEVTPCHLDLWQGVFFMTNRELLEQAMPMSTLTRQEWSAIQEHAEYLERTEKDSKLCNAVKQLLVNQARLEVRSNYLDQFNETLDDDVRENNLPIFI